MLKISQLKYRYHEGKEISYPDWSVASAEHAMILGDSGSGKTTLLHLLAALMHADQGTISLEGTVYPALKNIDTWRGQNIGMVFQKAHLVGALTVEENLDLAFLLNNNKVDKDRKRKVMDQLRIDEIRKSKPHQISQGQAQRVSIARALMNNPKLLLADEPTASLDDANAEAVVSLLKQQAEDTNAILVVATHDRRVKEHFENRLEL